MTYLLDDNGNEIVLNTEVSVTKQVLSFFNFKIRGNFSTNFRIPNTSATRAALGYYGANQSEKVAFSTQAWGLYKNGNLLGRGFLVIQGQNRTELDCFFAYGNASWINLLSGNLRELNWTNYDQSYTYTNLSTLKTATTGMVFPYFDPGFNFSRASHVFNIEQVPMYDATVDRNNTVYDIYPSFYIKTILKEVAKQKQIKITGNIFDDPVFDKMVIPIATIERYLTEENYLTDTDSYASDQYLAAGSTSTITFGYESNTSSDSLTNLSSNRIQAAGRSVNLRVKMDLDFNGPFSGEVYLRKNGATVYTYTFSVAKFTRYQTISLAPGDYLDLQIKNNGAATQSITKKYFGYQLCGSWYEPQLKILARDVVPNTQIMELLKYIVQAFNCIADFNDFTRTITINKIDSVRKENATDLTDTVVDYDIEWQNGFAKTNYIRTNQTADFDGFNGSELKFGEFSYDGPDNGKSQDDTFELKFGPSFVKPNNTPYIRWVVSHIPLFTLQDDGAPLTYSGVRRSPSDPKYADFTGISEQLTQDTIFRVKDDIGLYDGYHHVYDSTATTARSLSTFQATSTGKIYKQKIVFNISAGFRVLLNNPNYTISKIGVQSSMILNDVYGGGFLATTYPLAYYFIPDSDFTISDELRLGANPGDINGAISIPLSTQYYNRLQKIARNPVINARLRISETLFNTINLSEFVYIDIGEWSGYFFVQKIDNYKDSSTDVKVQLLKVD